MTFANSLKSLRSALAVGFITWLGLIILLGFTLGILTFDAPSQLQSIALITTLATSTLCAIISARHHWKYCKHYYRLQSNQCPTCGYNLTANQTGICPECGTPIPTFESLRSPRRIG